MLKKASIRWRLTSLSAILLTVCCIGLTIVLNFSAFRFIDEIDATRITTPATEVSPSQYDSDKAENVVDIIPSTELKEAKKGLGLQSILYMLLVILGGSALTYYISGKALKPLDVLNVQVKNLNINNLAESLEVPPTKDEIAELTESFNAMTDKLHNAFMMQKRFSASAAHELRTPLAVMQTKLDVFQKRSPHTSQEYDAIIEVFGKQTVRLRKLVGNLLDMTNMNDEREESDICLKEIFEDIISELSGIAKSKNISLLLHCDDISIYGNLDLIYRAFYNLIENGIKYNHNCGFVQIDVNMIKGKALIKITDNGIGIPDEMKKHIFEPFYRVDKSRSREMGGAGLGLSIVDSIIKKHNGSISVDDAESGGTCFKIAL